MTKEKTLGQRLGEAMIDEARKAGMPVVTITIPFLNNDVPEYLENLHRFEEASKKVSIMVGGDNCSYCRRAREMQRQY